MPKPDLGDIYLRLMIAQIAILLAIAGGVLTFILKTNDNVMNMSKDVSDIRVLLITEQFDDKTILKDMIVPSFKLSAENSEEIKLLNKIVLTNDSAIKTNRSNIIRIYDHVRGSSQ
ncbi:MAG: hypothetical protein PF440_00155 [Thiomicrorhabdus sp.]|jgi:hypothetical protein|nr:hypothetical protein [Thiomicrorhabdus sp.]